MGRLGRSRRSQQGLSIVLTPDEVVAATRTWIERAVIGLNLCPFAKAVYVKDQIRYAVSQAKNAGALLDDLKRELRILAETACSKGLAQIPHELVA
jgi:hypothetical protein